MFHIYDLRWGWLRLSWEKNCCDTTHLKRVPAIRLQTGQRFPIVSGGKIGLKIRLNIVCRVASLRLRCVVFPAGVAAASWQKRQTFLHRTLQIVQELTKGLTGKCVKAAQVCVWQKIITGAEKFLKSKTMPLTYAIPVFLLWHMNCCYRTVSHFLGTAITFLAVSFFSLRNTLYECRDFKNRTRPN